MGRRDQRRRSLRVRSLEAGLDEFLRAPSGDDGLSNGELVVKHLGTKGVDLADPPSFDAVRLQYEKPVETFRQAFRACWAGSRDWRRFDLATLRECDHLAKLQLPERVEAAIADEEREEAEREAAAEREAIQAEAAGEYDDAPAAEEFPPPPLELLHRSGPSSRVARRSIKKRRAPKRGRRNTPKRWRIRLRKRRSLTSVRALERAHKAAREAEELTGDLLRDVRRKENR